ncbi:hypothetical protein BDR06DRAFT_930192 [Suillus hirtellus]|nr:hypothetical protein BDR06DRAFT_930192 [Suillus hirtellus]
MWDDHTEHWQGTSIINIQGHPIAIEYWPLIYCYGHDQQWKGTKNKWTDWHVCTPEQFWASFRAANGEPLKFTAIIHRLHKECKEAHFALVECAHKEYGSDFFFTYRKGGEEHTMTRPSAIAKKYKELMVSNLKEVCD